MGSSSHKVHGLAELLTGSPHEKVYDPTNITTMTDNKIDQCVRNKYIKLNPIELKEKFIAHINNEILNQ